ncbi:MAG: ABC transporter ATP-binding protein [Alphaproteobacteria bacterium]
MLEIENVSVFYGRHQALDGVSASVAKGEIVVMLGANGAGKSTFLRAVSAITPKAGGRVGLEGNDLTNLAAHEIVEAGVALVPEGRGIFGELTVLENLRLGANPKRARTAEAENLDRILDLFPVLAERRKQIARTMSGGEQQMVAIGRAMMSAPEILLLDEPSLGLSPLLCGDLFRSLARVRETGVGVLLVEQNAKQSLAISDRGYLLENGHIVGTDTADALSNDERVQAAYLGAG